MMNNKRGQESGTLQNLLIGLLLVSTASVLVVMYINGFTGNYGVTINETRYEVFQQFDAVNESIGELTDQFINEEGEQTEATDIVTTIVTGGYNVIKLAFSVPSLFSGMIIGAAEELGMPAIMVRLATALVIILILFAAVALVMKVRA